MKLLATLTIRLSIDELSHATHLPSGEVLEKKSLACETTDPITFTLLINETEAGSQLSKVDTQLPKSYALSPYDDPYNKLAFSGLSDNPIQLIKCHDGGRAFSPQNQKWIDELRATLEGNYQDWTFCAGKLAELLGYNLKTLNRKLKELLGYTAIKIIRAFRMEKARHLLSQNDLTVSEICFAVGYSHKSHFISTFKSFYNQTPGEYKANHHKLTSNDQSNKRLFRDETLSVMVNT